MLTEARILNFKSIPDLTLKLGRVTVLIGENGCGKSNILEALAFAAAAAQDKLDNEFLASRGIRMTEPQFMRSAFTEGHLDEILLSVSGAEGRRQNWRLGWDGGPGYSRWREQGDNTAVIALKNTVKDDLAERLQELQREHQLSDDDIDEILVSSVRKVILRWLQTPSLSDFLIYSPENTSLRTFDPEGQIQPLGIKGEGLFKLLKLLSHEDHRDRLADIKDNLRLFDWFGDLRIARDLAPFESSLQIRDRYLPEDLAYFDQRSANEGFLFLLFYFSLFVSAETPSFFAIDNIDASLNPKLCSELMRRLTALAKKYGKQVLITTHNPAVLDGLDLNDDEQRLLVVYRTSEGHTKVRRVTPPQPIGDEPPVKLSEAFLRGILGGLPQNF
jgi:predicted ATPase